VNRKFSSPGIAAYATQNILFNSNLLRGHNLCSEGYNKIFHTICFMILDGIIFSLKIDILYLLSATYMTEGSSISRLLLIYFVLFIMPVNWNECQTPIQLMFLVSTSV
jgi:hypothetical protein